MPFDISISNQCIQLEDKIKTKMYQNLFEASQKTGWVRITGFGVGIAAALVTIALRVAHIFELIIKGIANLVGSLFSDKCSAKAGALQLFKSFPIAFGRLFLSMAVSIQQIFDKTFRVAIEPKAFFNQRWIAHDEEFKNMLASLEKITGTKLEENKYLHKDECKTLYFAAAFAKGDIGALFQLALLMYNGIGNQKDEAKGLEFMQTALNEAPDIAERVKDKPDWKAVLDFISEHELTPAPVAVDETDSPKVAEVEDAKRDDIAPEAEGPEIVAEEAVALTADEVVEIVVDSSKNRVEEEVDAV